MSSGVQDKIKRKESLASWTWWKVGGPADYFALPTTVDELQDVWRWAKQAKLPITILGGGSNVLISDQGVEGLVICLRKLVGLEVTESVDEIQISALAGTPKAEILKVFLKYNLAPALFICGLPGDVGGGVVMNAGVGDAISPREFHEITDWVEVLKESGDEFTIQRYKNSELHWEYRHSTGWQPGVITRVGIKWPNSPVVGIMDKVKEATRNRLQRQPLNLPSCGSVFKNPPGHKSGFLIEQAGLKGFTIGGAQVSPKHANFIVNMKQAKASEIHQIIQHVKTTIKKQFDVELETEVKYIGRWVPGTF